MIKFFRKIHLWLSVPFGIIITLVCFSGAMLIFEPEITRTIKSDVYYVSEVKGDVIPMNDLLDGVKSTLPDSVSITGVTVFNDNSRTYQVNLSKPRRASVFVDQYTSRITGKYERLGFFSTMFKLHRWLLDSANPHGDGMKIGKLLVGISTLVFVIALVSGIVIWWPRARKNLRGSLSISFSKGWKGFWKGLHVAGGMYALFFVLAMALTGLTWSFNWYRTAFYAVCGVEHTPRNTASAPAQAHTGNDEKDGQRRGGEGRGHREGGDGRGRHGGEGREGRGGHGGGRHRSEFGRWQKVYDELKADNP
ncbi:MAG: PepSY domain-containing protein, partial [Paramuribaculum sp.]|nr:PepSY domain-containing protein [Paramuribaculum sp.]